MCIRDSVNTVQVPAGWFCLCFPDDAHVPCISGAEEHAIVKLMLKVKAIPLIPAGLFYIEPIVPQLF